MREAGPETGAKYISAHPYRSGEKRPLCISLAKKLSHACSLTLSILPFGGASYNRLGPNLHKIIGRKAGSLPGYSYSPAMKDADFVWDEANLARFKASPDQVVPGNKMAP